MTYWTLLNNLTWPYSRWKLYWISNNYRENIKDPELAEKILTMQKIVDILWQNKKIPEKDIINLRLYLKAWDETSISKASILIDKLTEKEYSWLNKVYILY